MRKRNEAKPIQGWGWLGDAAEEAVVQAMAPARRSKNATATAATKANKKSAASHGETKPGGVAQLTDDDYRQLAEQRYESEGEVEIDPHARVSRSEDRMGETGAWVQGWVFVSKPERG